MYYSGFYVNVNRKKKIVFLISHESINNRHQHFVSHLKCIKTKNNPIYSFIYANHSGEVFHAIVQVFLGLLLLSTKQHA